MVELDVQERHRIRVKFEEVPRIFVAFDHDEVTRAETQVAIRECRDAAPGRARSDPTRLR